MKQKSSTVFIISLILCIAMVVWAIALNDSFTVAANAMFSFFTVDFAWLYLAAMLAMVIFVIVLAFSKYGNIKLGPDDSEPEYSTVSWFAMLFGCGMGVGLVFWGIAEPMAYYVGPMAGIDPETPAAAAFAFEAVYMHWGITPWANYAVMGLALAYFQFRKNKPALVSTVLEPLIGENLTKGWLGKLVDIVAIFATLAGVVTSLGLGVIQINAGLTYMFNAPNNLLTQSIIIIIVTVIVIWSAVSGIEKGIKLISDINLRLAAICLGVCFLVGPTLAIMNNLVGGLGNYVNFFVRDSLLVNAYGDNSWLYTWRIFYFAWFIAWAPFVGVFIARISRGRTIKEFIAGVVLVPGLSSIIWFAVFGSMGLSLATSGAIDSETAAAIAGAPETGLFIVINQYPLGFILSIAFIVLLCTFFITSANSGTFVLGMLSSDGDLNPSSGKKILWGVMQAAMAIGLLMAGGLKPLQTISIAAAFPFIFIQICAMISIVKALKTDPYVTGIKDDSTEAAPALDAEAAATTA